MTTGKRQPTEEEKDDFIAQVVVTMQAKKGSPEWLTADQKIKNYIKTFDCGCKFRDRMFKQLYQAVAKGRTGQAKLILRVFAKSFKYESLRNLLGSLTNAR